MTQPIVQLAPAVVLPTDLEPRLLALVTARLEESVVLPELHQALVELTRLDAARLAQGRHWSWLIPSLQHLLGGAAVDTLPFLTAWCLLHLATVRLDHLQDGDPGDLPLLPGGARVQIQLALSAYALATSLLDALDPTVVPPRRLLQLHRLWSSLLLRTASGQQRDLTLPASATAEDTLVAYQELAQAKSGAMFALAFAGTATLLSDDAAVIDRYCAVGELFGTLVQYSDDVLDQATQLEDAATLPAALRAAAHAQGTHAGADHGQAFWAYLYPSYLAALADLTAAATPAERSGLRALFATAFEQANARSPCP